MSETVHLLREMRKLLDHGTQLVGEIRNQLADLNDFLVSQQKPVRRKREQLIEAGLPEIVKLWNTWAHESLARVVSMDAGSPRYKNAVARWRGKPQEDYWIGVIRRVNASAFCLGMNERKWKADIEFLCRPDQHARILEGKYDDKTVEIKKRELVGYTTGADGQSVPVFK